MGEIAEAMISGIMCGMCGEYLDCSDCEEMGKEYDVTRERVRQIEAVTLEKLQRYLSDLRIKHKTYEGNEQTVEADTGTHLDLGQYSEED